jgi:hypothetical protein
LINPKTPAQQHRRRIRAEKEILGLYAGRIAEAKFAAKRFPLGTRKRLRERKP